MLAAFAGALGVCCDRLHDTRIDGIRSCGVYVYPGRGEIIVGLSEQQGDAELRRVVPHLKELNEPIELYLKDSKVTDDGLAALEGVQNLRMINLSNTQITDSGLSRLSALPGLREIVLTGTRVTNAGVRKLKEARPAVDVEKLSESEKTTQAQDRALPQIGEAGGRFIYAGPRIIKSKPIMLWFERSLTDSDLRRLKESLEAWNNSLQELQLTDEGITDAGLVNLEGLTHLRRLTLIGTKVTDAGERKLRQALPKLEVLRLPPGSPAPTPLPPP